MTEHAWCGLYAGFLSMVGFMIGCCLVFRTDFREWRNRERVGDYDRRVVCTRCLWSERPDLRDCISGAVCPECGGCESNVICRPICIGRKVVRWERRGS